MSARGVIRILAGPASIVTIAMLVLLLSIGGTQLLSQRKSIGLRIGNEVALAKASALAESALRQQVPEIKGSSFTTLRYPDALNASSAPPVDELTASAIEALRRDPGRAHHRFYQVNGWYRLQYAVHDGSGGAVVVDLDLDSERAAIGRVLGLSHVSGIALSILAIGLLGIGIYTLRRFLRDLIRRPEDERRDVITAGLREADIKGRPNLLIWLIGLCAVVFAIDLSNVWDEGVGIGYVLAVTIALASNRYWHIMAIAGLCTALLLTAPLLAPYDGSWWRYLENYAVTLFAIVVTSLFGSANMRKTQAEARALAEAAQSKLETHELRSALERAEAAEASRRAMLERVSMANAAAGISTWEWNFKTNIVTIEPDTAFAQRIGKTSYSADEGETHVHPESIEGYRQAFIRAIEGPPGPGDYFSYRYRFCQDRPDGTPRYIQFHARVLRSQRGRPYGVLGVDWEATDEELSRREIARQAQELREAQARFERAVSGTQDALFEFDFTKNTAWASPRLPKMLGLSAEQIGATIDQFQQLVHPDDRESFRTAMSSHILHDTPFDIEFRMLKGSGGPLWVRARANAERAEDGRPLMLAGSISDITEARAAREATIRAAQEAEAASLAKSTFLATMSHEIRTPMNGIIGMTGLLLESGLDRQQREYAETIRASADLLLTILNDVLDFSKIEAGKLDIESIDFDLTTAVEDVGSLMAFQAAAKGIELVVNVRPEVPQRVLGDPQRIRQCLLNLVGNAIKFTQHGEVVVEVCTLGRQDGKALVHFEVRDTGIGIDPATLSKLFQPFTQADSSTTRKFGGTGLGLSIVRRLVEMMGGRTGAQSVPEQGSTFWFTLPLETIDVPEVNERSLLAASGKRVLLVDDNETNRRVLAGQIQHAGYTVEMAANGIQALAMLRRPHADFDVVVLDYQMPDMDGAMLGQQIMEAKDIPATRLVLLTSLDRSGDMQRFADIGFSAYLTKPVRTRELLDCLERALARDAQDWYMRSQPIITRGTLIAHESRRQYSGKVLLVEDNAINQRVARRFLERLGCMVCVVGDGLQAVEAYSKDTFDFILMDMQMPVMDGLEATRRIRDLEAGKRRTPIVALTANAMMGTLERCLEAGMDDYLTKPLDISRLEDVLDRFLGERAQSAQSTGEQPVAAPKSSNPIEEIRARLLDIAGGDVGFVADLVETFAISGTDALREMSSAAQAQDIAAVGRAAHKLKGASSNLHIESLAELASKVEIAAKEGTLTDPAQSLATLTSEFQRIVMALREICAVPPSNAIAG